MRGLAVALMTAISAAALAQTGLAADLPVKVPMATPAAVPYSWAGFYVGIEGGGGWADTRHTNTINGINSGTVGINGGLFGGTVGYNAQLGSWVFGVESDFSWSGIKSNFNDNNDSFFCSEPLQCVTNLRWFGTGRGRLGYAWDRFLVYGTAGIAYGNVEGTLANAGFLVSVGNTTREGFVYGAGVEWAFAPAWSVKAEYLRTDLGSQITYHVITIFPEIVSLTNINIVRVGLNYHFH